MKTLLAPFIQFAYDLRNSLEDSEGNRFPRWVRMARGRELTGGEYEVMQGQVTALLDISSACVELILDMRELAEAEIDQRKSRAERVLNDIERLLKSPSRGTLSGPWGSRSIAPSMDRIESVLRQARDTLDAIPDSKDVQMLGRPFYHMLCIEQKPMPMLRAGQVDESEVPSSAAYVDLSKTGKLRLLQWAFELPWTIWGLGSRELPESRAAVVSRLGTRWLWQTPNSSLPAESVVRWAVEGSGSRTVPIVEHLFTLGEPEEKRRTADLWDAHQVLETLDYKDPVLEDHHKRQFTRYLGLRLEMFQAMNGLDRSAELDNATLNRMYHLDYVQKTILRAVPNDPSRFARIAAPPKPPPEISVEIVTVGQDRPYPVPALGTPRASGSLALVNADADRPGQEGILLQSREAAPEQLRIEDRASSRPYWFYVCGAGAAGGGAKFPPGVRRGWISHAGETSGFEGEGALQAGFVALESRALQTQKAAPPEWHGGPNSEGGAASGRFFFAARSAEPWVPGRRDSNPRKQPLPLGYDPKPGHVVGMYQWASVLNLVLSTPPGKALVFVGRVAQRSRIRAAGVGSPDQGKLVLGLLRASSWSKARYATLYSAAALGRSLVTSGWWPTPNSSTAYQVMSDSVLGDDWVLRSSPMLRVPQAQGRDPVSALFVGLYGRAQQGEDIDAWFDDLSVSYEYRDAEELAELSVTEGELAVEGAAPEGWVEAESVAEGAAATAPLGPEESPSIVRVRLQPQTPGGALPSDVVAVLLLENGRVFSAAEPDETGLVELSAPARGRYTVRVVPRSAIPSDGGARP